MAATIASTDSEGRMEKGYYYTRTAGGGAMSELLYIGILIHGIVFGFLVVGGQVYVGKTAKPEMLGQAQGFYAMMAFGIGSIIGAFANDALINKFTQRTLQDDGVTYLKMGDWNMVWLVTLVVAIVCLVVMALFFNPKEDKQKAA